MANINFFCKDVVMLTAKMGVNVNVFDKTIRESWLQQ